MIEKLDLDKLQQFASHLRPKYRAALSSTCPQPVFMFGLRAMGRGIFRRLLLLSENNINPSYTVMPAQITG